MRNADQAPEGRAGHAEIVIFGHREEEIAMWENPTLRRELANLTITERVRRASRQHRQGR